MSLIPPQQLCWCCRGQLSWRRQVHQQCCPHSSWLTVRLINTSPSAKSFRLPHSFSFIVLHLQAVPSAGVFTPVFPGVFPTNSNLLHHRPVWRQWQHAAILGRQPHRSTHIKERCWWRREFDHSKYRKFSTDISSRSWLFAENSPDKESCYFINSFS